MEGSLSGRDSSGNGIFGEPGIGGFPAAFRDGHGRCEQIWSGGYRCDRTADYTYFRMAALAG